MGVVLCVLEYERSLVVLAKENIDITIALTVLKPPNPKYKTWTHNLPHTVQTQIVIRFLSENIKSSFSWLFVCKCLVHGYGTLNLIKVHVTHHEAKLSFSFLSLSLTLSFALG